MFPFQSPENCVFPPPTTRQDPAFGPDHPDGEHYADPTNISIINPRMVREFLAVIFSPPKIGFDENSQTQFCIAKT